MSDNAAVAAHNDIALPWCGGSVRFPRTFEEGADSFSYSCEQVEIIEREAKADAIRMAIEEIATNDRIEHTDDFIRAVHAIAEVGRSFV